MEDEKFEIVVLQVNEDTGATEITMHNRLTPYIPTEYILGDYNTSKKTCHCGRQTWLNDNWCPACGQKLGMPNIYNE
jgi:hypothetical protein